MPKVVTGCSSTLGCLGVCVAKESGRCGGVGGAKEQGEVPHPTDMKPAPKALPRYTGMAGNKLSNHRRPTAPLHGRLPPMSRHAQTNPEGSRGKKKGVNAGRGRSPRLHDCTAKQLRRAPTNIDATVDSRISRGSPEKRKRFFYPYGSSTRKQLLAAYENASNSESSRVSRHSLLGASEAGNGSLYTMILQTPFC